MSNKHVVSEIIKSTFFTLALFALFDILVQGYQPYHHWLIAFFIGAPVSYYLISRTRTSHH